VAALAKIIFEVRGALGVGVEVLTDPSMLVQLPHGNGGLFADVGVLYYHGIRGSKLALDAVVSGLFGISSPQSPGVALRRAKKTKFEKYSEGVKSRPDIRFICGHGIQCSRRPRHGFLNGLARQAAAFKGMHVGKLLASWRRKVSLAVHVALADNVLRGLSAAADCGEAASSSDGMPSHAMAFFTRVMGPKRTCASSRGA
jgi:hypothetical protein